MLGELIRQLDTRRQQVLVEAIVVEIGDDAAKKLGVQFLLGGKNIPFVATSYSNASPNILTLGGAYASTRISEETTTTDGTTVGTETSSGLDRKGGGEGKRVGVSGGSGGCGIH